MGRTSLAWIDRSQCTASMPRRCPRRTCRRNGFPWKPLTSAIGGSEQMEWLGNPPRTLSKTGVDLYAVNKLALGEEGPCSRAYSEEPRLPLNQVPSLQPGADTIRGQPQTQKTQKTQRPKKHKTTNQHKKNKSKQNTKNTTQQKHKNTKT